MRVSRRTAAAALVASLPSAALAQTSTSCNPLDSTCPADPGLNKASFASDFTQGQNASWSVAEGTTVSYSDSGALFSIKAAGQAPTVSTDFYFLFGRVDVTMKASPGTGIISSVVLLSDDLDEIDWEFIGGNTTTVETNFFGKGNTTSYDRAIYYPVDNPQANTHTYTIDWTSEKLDWIIDGTTVRSLPYNDPIANGGEDYPQTPMRLRLGNWAAGGPGEPEGTVEWAGGSTDFSQAPFNMYVEKVSVTNYNPADSYEFEGNSGSWKDIKIVNGGKSASPSSTGSSSPASSSNTSAPTSSISINTQHTGVAVPTTTVGGGSVSTSAPAQSTAAGVSTTTALSVPATVSSVAPTSTSPPTNGASTNAAYAGASLLSVLIGAFML